jgi:hypothetical protein
MSIKAQSPIEVPLKYQKLCKEIINFEVHPEVYFFKLYDGINLFGEVFEPYSRSWEATPYQIEQEEQMFKELKALFDGYSYILSQIYKKPEGGNLELKLTGVRFRLREARKFLNEPIELIERNQKQYKEIFLFTLQEVYKYLEEAFYTAKAKENKNKLNTHTE